MYESLYKTKSGRALATFFAKPAFSHMAGAFLDSGLSRALIKPFINKNGVDMSEVAEDKFVSFNAFFTRRLKDGCRVADANPSALISPCDGLLSAYDIKPSGEFLVKGHAYTVAELLNDSELAREFTGGLFLSFRLTPSDYHRYMFIDDGVFATREKRIAGAYHTVRPMALENVSVYKTNTREYAVLETKAFGRCIQMEVGATLVGRIKNTVSSGAFRRGDEKGMFEFGGSTVILLIGAGKARLDHEIINVDGNGERRVRAGERIGQILTL